MKTSPLVAEDVTLSYRDGERETFALAGVSLELPPGGFWGIMGPSGSGKSSLLYVLSGLKQASGGRARFGEFVYGEKPESERLALRRARFGFVFQQPFLLGYLSAIENALVAAPRPDAAARKKALERFEALGLSGKAERLPSQLSGGERQRVSVVRALMNDPEVIFADEPTASLDRKSGQAVIEALAAWRGDGSLVVVTHDPLMVEKADAVARLADGKLACFGPPGEVS